MRPAAGAPALVARQTFTGGRRIHALVSRRPQPATAPRIVLVHGLIASGRYLAPTAELLARDCHVAVPDLPGFGWSEAPEAVLDAIGLAEALHRFLVALGTVPAVLVGHSMGTQVAAHVAVRHPDAVDKLALVAPTFDPAGGGLAGMAARWLRDAAHEPLAVHRVVAHDAVRCGPRRALCTYRHGLRDRLEEQLARLGMPTLVVRGSHDVVAPPAWVHRVASLTPSAQVAVVPGARHLLNWTHPAELAALLRSFALAEHPRPPP